MANVDAGTPALSEPTTEPFAEPAPPAGPGAIRVQTLVGTGVLLTGLALAAGAIGISSEASYGGVGPNFLPWVVSIMLTLCGGFIVWEARTGGFRDLDAPSGAAQGFWPGFVWVSAGLLLNAALITVIGFILSCTLCYVLAVQGLRRAAGQSASSSPRTWAIDTLTGLLIASPVFWTFTKFLAINLPGLTSTGWL